MAQVTLPHTLTPGTPENVNNLVANLNALRDGVNTIDTAQIASGAVTAAKIGAGAVETAKIADGAISVTKLESDVLGYAGISSGATTRRAGIIADAEYNRGNNTSFADVTGASGTIDVATGSYTQIVASWEGKVSADGTNVSAVHKPRLIVGSVTLDLPQETATSYTTRTFASGFASAATGTGTQTVKMQLASGYWSCCGDNWYVSYVKNVRIYMINYKI